MQSQLVPAQQQNPGNREQTLRQYQLPPSRNEEGLRVLQRIFKRNLRKNFDYL